MRKIVRILLLGALFTVLLCGSALATGEKGMYAVTQGLKPMTATSADAISPTSKTTTTGETITDYYVDAERVQLDQTGLTEGDECLVFVLDDSSGKPTADNIVYIDQLPATSTGVSFTIYPKSLTPGKTYTVYMSTKSSTTGLDNVGSFQYYADYIRGDANQDKRVNYKDAVLILQSIVDLKTLSPVGKLAADVFGNDGKVNYKDAVKILQYTVDLVAVL